MWYLTASTFHQLKVINSKLGRNAIYLSRKQQFECFRRFCSWVININISSEPDCTLFTRYFPDFLNWAIGIIFLQKKICNDDCLQNLSYCENEWAEVISMHEVKESEAEFCHSLKFCRFQKKGRCSNKLVSRVCLEEVSIWGICRMVNIWSGVWRITLKPSCIHPISFSFVLPTT